MTRSAFAATVVAAAVLILASSPPSLAAQGRWDSGNRGGQRLQRPPTPYGLCRVWIRGVPPERQPAVTGCAYAYSNVPRNGRVIYGGERGQLFGRRSSPYFYDSRGRERDYRDRDFRIRGHYGRDYRDGSYRGTNDKHHSEHDRGYEHRYDRGHGRWK